MGREPRPPSSGWRAPEDVPGAGPTIPRRRFRITTQNGLLWFFGVLSAYGHWYVYSVFRGMYASFGFDAGVSLKSWLLALLLISPLVFIVALLTRRLSQVCRMSRHSGLLRRREIMAILLVAGVAGAVVGEGRILLDEASYRDQIAEGRRFSRSRRSPLGGRFYIDKNGRFSATAGTVRAPARWIAPYR